MKIICIGRNYGAHAKELNNPVPAEPVIFLKPDTARIPGDKKVFFLPSISNDMHHEIEIVLKISKNGKNIAEKFAHKYYEEISVGIDFTARDLQNKLKSEKLPWELAKAFDQSAPVGNFISKSKINFPYNFRLEKNGAIVQKGNTSDMIFSFDKIISFVSNYFTLQLGDLIFTGTPEGVGPVQAGDKLAGFLENEKLLELDVK